MAMCECLGGCLFYNDKMKNKDSLAAIYKKKYCEGDNKQCARYTVFKKCGKAAVPSDLFPNMMDKAKKIIAS